MASYGAGYINTLTMVVSEIQLPDGRHAYRGPVLGQQILGCKGKMDYAGHFWFFAVDDQINPTHLWLYRATRLPNGTIQLDGVEVPEFTEGICCRPNQLTVDKNGAVYYTSGVINYVGHFSYYKAVVTSETPFTVTFTTMPFEYNEEEYSLLGITLNKAHTYLVTYLISSAPGSFDEWQRVPVTLDNLQGGPVAAHKATIFPTNIETDVSGGQNDNRAVGYFSTVDHDYIVAIDPDDLDPWGTAGITELNPTAYNRSVAIHPDGTLSTYVRHDYTPAANREYTYQPLATHDYDTETLVNLTQPFQEPTHGDIRRALDDTWLGCGVAGLDTGRIKEITAGGVQTDRFNRLYYQIHSVGCVREAYT